MATTPVPNPASPDNPLPPVQSQPAAQPDPEVARLRAEVDRHRQTIDQLKSRFTAAPQPAVTQQPPDLATMNRDFLRDPVQHAANIARVTAQQVTEQVFGSQRDTLIQTARNQVRAKDPETFDRYALEIENAVSQAGPQFAGNINVWENAFRLVKGSHIDEILAARGQQPPPEPPRAPAVHISNEGGPAAPSARPGQAPKGVELSEREKYTARRLGLTEDLYKAGKEHYEKQNDPVLNPVGKSSWDDHITFSSQDARRKARAARSKK